MIEREKLEQRLADLKSEYEAGQKMLAELDQKRHSLTQTLLRIEGAIQVLQEMQQMSEGNAGSVGSESGKVGAAS